MGSVQTRQLAIASEQTTPHLALFATLNGEFAAAASASKLNSVVRYNPTNLTTTFEVFGFNSAPTFTFGSASIQLPAGGTRDGALSLPSVRPLLENDAALLPPGLLAASAAAACTAERSAEGLAPRMVDDTEPFLRIRKVGMLRFRCCQWMM